MISICEKRKEVQRWQTLPRYAGGASLESRVIRPDYVDECGLNHPSVIIKLKGFDIRRNDYVYRVIACFFDCGSKGCKLKDVMDDPAR